MSNTPNLEVNTHFPNQTIFSAVLGVQYLSHLYFDYHYLVELLNRFAITYLLIMVRNMVRNQDSLFSQYQRVQSDNC